MQPYFCFELSRIILELKATLTLGPKSQQKARVLGTGHPQANVPGCGHVGLTE